MVAAIRHPRAGLILFDTGYGRPLVEARSFAAKAYRAILPFRYGDDDAIPRHLERLGIPPAEIRTIFLSHFHPDHIGSLRELPAVPIVHSKVGMAELRSYSPWQQARAAYFSELLPGDFARRSHPIEELQRVQLDGTWLPFTEAYDIAGDGSLLAVALPGHAIGQFGLLCRIESRKWIFLIADAAWTRRNITAMALPGWPAGALIGDPATYRATLRKLHDFQLRRRDVILIPSHCRESIEAYQRTRPA